VWWVVATVTIFALVAGAIGTALLLRGGSEPRATGGATPTDTTAPAATAARLATLIRPIAARQRLVSRRVDDASSASSSRSTRLIRLAAASLERELLLARGRSDSLEATTQKERAQVRAFSNALAKHLRYATLLEDVSPSSLTTARVNTLQRAARAAANEYVRLTGTGVNAASVAIAPAAHARVSLLAAPGPTTQVRLTPLVVMPGEPFRCISPYDRDHGGRIALVLRFANGRESRSISSSYADRTEDFLFCGGSTTYSTPGYASGTVRFSKSPRGRVVSLSGAFGADFDAGSVRRPVTLVVTSSGRTVCRLSTDGAGHARRFTCKGFPSGATISNLRVGLRVSGDRRYSVFAGIQDLVATVQRASSAPSSVRKIPAGPRSTGVPAVYDGHFTSVDRLQRCYAQGREAWCTSGPSGQRVRLVAGVGAFNQGRPGSRDVGGPSMPEGTSFRTSDGRITCSSSFRGIGCRDSAGRGFVLGDRRLILYSAGGRRVG
jgi:hypothetical protein